MSEDAKKEETITSCYTYEVTVVVQVLASNKEEANEKLEREGGFISKREVIFRDAVTLYSGENSE